MSVRTPIWVGMSVQGYPAPAARDPVTGAWPRGVLQEALRDVAGHSLLLFDVDHFKTVNDAFGHQRGDLLLRQLAERVQSLLRPDDALVRYGGDEFVVLLPATGPRDALALAIRLTDGVRGSEFEGTPPLHLSVSVGVASSPADGTDGDALVAAADRRNYLAKRRGRAQAVGDDVETSAASGSSRLWERDTALSGTQEFLTRVAAGGRAALRIAGPKGAGHTRFLREVAQIARLRGFATGGEPGPGTILLADVDEPLPALGESAAIVYATTDPFVVGTGLPETVVELTPWSPATVRIWLRIALAGEPTAALVDRLVQRSGGLPAVAEGELKRLREQGALVANEDGTWGVKAAAPRRGRSRLPVPMTKLVGRDRETATVANLVRDGRLVTLVGPGGVGKTRLSLAAAGAVEGELADGAVFVPLADTTGADLVVAALASALRVPELPDQRLFDTVLDHLAEVDDQLLVLDNFEQIVDDSAVLVSELLAAAPGVRVLVTSRERLSLYGEQVYQVPPLPDAPAVGLFEQRARAIDSAFRITADTVPAVTALCHLLDGLPLAIELAAARIDKWSPAELLDHLTSHLHRDVDLLGGTGLRDRPARQLTLRGAIDWSFVLLDADQQRLMTDLSVFAGGWSAAAALAVTAPGGDLALLVKRLGTLVDKSLVVRTDEDRYDMLSTIRSYMRGQLADAAEPLDRHADFYAAFAETSAVGLAGPDQVEWTGRIELDYQNIRAAFEHGDIAAGTRICLGLWRYWRNGVHIREGRDWLARTLTADTLEEGVRARLLHGAAVLAATQDEHQTAQSYGAEALRRALAVGDRGTVGHAYNALGIAAIGGGDAAAAIGYFGESLAVWTELDVPQGVAASLGNLAKASLSQGDITAADSYAAQCLTLERAAGNTRGILLALECVGQIMLARGDVAAARTALDESLALSRQIGDAFGAAMAEHQLGLAALADGDPVAALRLLVAAMGTRNDIGDRLDLAISLDVIASVLSSDDPARAARLIGAADALRSRHHLPEPPDDQTLRSLTLPRIARHQRDRTAGHTTALDQIVEELRQV